jgi:hypothetical protein
MRRTRDLAGKNTPQSKTAHVDAHKGSKLPIVGTIKDNLAPRNTDIARRRGCHLPFFSDQALARQAHTVGHVQQRLRPDAGRPGADGAGADRPGSGAERLLLEWAGGGRAGAGPVEGGRIGAVGGRIGAGTGAGQRQWPGRPAGGGGSRSVAGRRWPDGISEEELDFGAQTRRKWTKTSIPTRTGEKEESGAAAAGKIVGGNADRARSCSVQRARPRALIPC